MASKSSDLPSRPLWLSHKNNGGLSSVLSPGTGELSPAVSSRRSAAPRSWGQRLTARHGFQGLLGSGLPCPIDLPPSSPMRGPATHPRTQAGTQMGPLPGSGPGKHPPYHNNLGRTTRGVRACIRAPLTAVPAPSALRGSVSRSTPLSLHMGDAHPLGG